METLHANKRIKEQLVQTKLPVKNKNMLKKLENQANEVLK